jgi:serine/threonine protein kinase
VFKDKYCYPNILNYSAESPFRITTELDPKNKDPIVMCFRQYVCFNLHDKLRELLSELSRVEKKWLVFQLLCAVNQLHSKEYVHGDIKPENILVNSYNWLSLADISTADKPVLCMDDNL